MVRCWRAGGRGGGAGKGQRREIKGAAKKTPHFRTLPCNANAIHDLIFWSLIYCQRIGSWMGGLRVCEKSQFNYSCFLRLPPSSLPSDHSDRPAALTALAPISYN